MLWIILLSSLSTVHSWRYNPYCWVKDCEPNPSKTDSFLNKLNPYCFFSSCEEPTASGASWNLQCWFTDCKKTSRANGPFWSFDFSFWQSENIHNSKATWSSQLLTTLQSLYSFPVEWFRGKFANQVQDNGQDDRNSWYCRFINCPDKQHKEGIFSMMKKYASNYIPSGTSIRSAMNSLNPKCWYEECCSETNIPGDYKKLHKLLHGNLFGQTFTEDIASAIAAHWWNKKANKALVMSFHGLSSTGKTHAIQLISESLYKNGINSAFVHYFSGGVNFQNEALSHLYQHELYHWIKGNVTKCPKQLFIFDGVHRFPITNLFEEIVPLLHRNNIQGVDFTQSIFIFTSNSEGELIKEKFIGLRKQHFDRKNMQLLQFEKIITEKIYSETDKSIFYTFKDQNVIDHYIPFFPLETDDILNFIRREFRQRGVKQPHQEHIDQIMSSLLWEEREGYRFPKTDLRIIISKISLYATKYYKLQIES